MDSTQKAVGRPDDTTPSVKKGKNYLLAIGIDAYQHCPRLFNAVRDAQEFVSLLKERYFFDTENIIQIYNKDATNRRIQNELRSLAQRITSEDNLIVYYSGHGEYDKVFEQGYWVPVNAERGQYDDYLPNSTVRDALNVIKSHHTFLIVDSCFSGALFSSRDANRSIAERLEADSSRWGLTAGRNEIVSDGRPGANSPFAEKLLNLLRKNDKPLGVAEICAKMMEIVQANADQTPRGEPLKIKGHEGGQFFFHPRYDEATDWEKACDENSILAFKTFLKNYPLSLLASEAERRIAELQEEQTWEQAKKWHNETSYFSYLKDYPNGKYVSEAKAAMRDIADTIRWEKAKKENSVIAFWEYLEAFPSGKYAQDAQKGLAEFERKNKDKTPPQPQEKPEQTAPKEKTPKTPTEKEAPRKKKEEATHTSPLSTTTETESENWKINKINVYVGVTLGVVFIIGWLVNAYLIQPMLHKVPEVISKVTSPNQQQGVPYDTSQLVVNTPKIGVSTNDPFNGQMVFVKGGTFKMGGNKYDNEKPIHEVSLSDYYIGKYEVSQAQWKAIMGNNPSEFKGDDLPVENVSWNDVQEFFKKLNAKTGKKYRLPTEAEWEYAARGGQNFKDFEYSGSNTLNAIAWYDENAERKTHPVGQKQANELGLYDMSGNIWEWCHDWYSENYYKISPTVNPQGSNNGGLRVCRGGSWTNDGYSCYVTYRSYNFSPIRDNSMGFRVARYD